jgi:hypothetical protein
MATSMMRGRSGQLGRFAIAMVMAINEAVKKL